MGYKFISLEKYLENSNEDVIELTFKDIERILGFELSPSAYNHRSYWSLSKTHAFPQSWLNPGYKLGRLNLKEQKVLFMRYGLQTIGINSDTSAKLNKEVRLVDTCNQSINIELAVENINKYLNEISEDKNARYLSWEHCYKQFGLLEGKVLTEEEVDLLSLNLAFYLASWGMYRGSSFLLKKDYKVHNDAIMELYKEEYRALWGICYEEILQESNLKQIFRLSKKLKNIYVKNRQNVDGRDGVSDILITKILMGTLGCVPAYDRYFIKAIRKYKIASGAFNRNSLYDLGKFYEEHNEKLEGYRFNISRNDIEYPQMKILDMCFWQIGYDMENDKG